MFYDISDKPVSSFSDIYNLMVDRFGDNFLPELCFGAKTDSHAFIEAKLKLLSAKYPCVETMESNGYSDGLNVDTKYLSDGIKWKAVFINSNKFNDILYNSMNVDQFINVARSIGSDNLIDIAREFRPLIKLSDERLYTDAPARIPVEDRDISRLKIVSWTPVCGASHNLSSVFNRWFQEVKFDSKGEFKCKALSSAGHLISITFKEDHSEKRNRRTIVEEYVRSCMSIEDGVNLSSIFNHPSCTYNAFGISTVSDYDFVDSHLYEMNKSSLGNCHIMLQNEADITKVGKLTRRPFISLRNFIVDKWKAENGKPAIDSINREYRNFHSIVKKAIRDRRVEFKNPILEFIKNDSVENFMPAVREAQKKWPLNSPFVGTDGNFEREYNICFISYMLNRGFSLMQIRLALFIDKAKSNGSHVSIYTLDKNNFRDIFDITIDRVLRGRMSLTVSQANLPKNFLFMILSNNMNSLYKLVDNSENRMLPVEIVESISEMFKGDK